jgi:SAM-dependent methyltransferase
MNYNKSDVAAFLHGFKISLSSTEWVLGYEPIFKSLQGLQRVLDFGCGSGWFGQRLVEAGISVDGVDVAEAMVGLANKVSKGVSVISGNALTFVHEAYDAAVANFVFCEYSSRQSIIADMRLIHQALKPGGKLFILHSNWDKSVGMEFRSYVLNHTILSPGAEIHVTLKGDLPVEIADYFWPQEDYKQMLLEAGFSGVVIDECMAPRGEAGWLAETESSPLYVITATK